MAVPKSKAVLLNWVLRRIQWASHELTLHRVGWCLIFLIIANSSVKRNMKTFYTGYKEKARKCSGFLMNSFFVQCSPSVYVPKLGLRSENHRTRSMTMRALGSSGDNPTAVAPLQFESPTGQFLSQILHTHPHLLPAAIDQQLEILQMDRDAKKEETSPATQDLLYRLVIEVDH